jgi:hypothetical protein
LKEEEKNEQRYEKRNNQLDTNHSYFNPDGDADAANYSAYHR